VITGATSGIGYQAARMYASRGANLLCINRNIEKSTTLRDEITREFGGECEFKIADFERIADIKKVGNELVHLEKRIDVLICNAGVFSTRKEITGDGYELAFQVNYLATFLLTYMLREKLKQQGNARIIYVNSEGHRFATWGIHLDDLAFEKHKYDGYKSYGASKTAQLLSMIKFNDYFSGSSVTINAMHPGDVKSNIGANNGRLYRWYKKHLLDPTLKSPERSATALYYLGVSPDVSTTSGKFFNLTTVEIPAPPARDRDVAEALWDTTITMLGLR
ncbi:MAG: SDR family NAD(P)-dependent oxidoreductase, partial [Candidatus Lokiarchaeota archaeon]|nr:SDR family NAD(P)-dependent oxidoreductase [Candidatus Lokiarchaeota archaeon]